MLRKTTIEKFLKELASKKPTPGGGSAAALTGAQACALCAMVGKLSGSKRAQNCAIKAERFQKVLEGIIDQDTKAFNAVMRAYVMPKSTKNQREKRKDKIQEALKRATEVPLQTARYGYETLKLAEILVDEGNQSAISDVGTAALLCGASIKSALLNIRINLSSIKDDRFREEIEKGIDKIIDYPIKTAEISNEVYKKISG